MIVFACALKSGCYALFMMTISSQRYLDEETVEAKRAASDFVVYYINAEVGGEDYRVVVDGHHSLAAAKAEGVEPEWTHQASVQQDANAVGHDAWLLDHQHDADWYDVETGINVW